MFDSAVTLTNQGLSNLRVKVIKPLHEIEILEYTFCDVWVHDTIIFVLVEPGFKMMSEESDFVMISFDGEMAALWKVVLILM